MQFIIGQAADGKREAEKQIVFYSEKSAYVGVAKIADKVRQDVERVTGMLPEITEEQGKLGSYPVVFGTIGRSPMLEQLQQEGKIDLSAVQGKREVYLFQLVEAPWAGVECALIIAGSDKRGTIYGLFHLSECLGVSPLVNWSDVRPRKQERVVLTERHNRISREPSVKYRGIFINDEWPAFGNWAMHHFGGLNAKMYEHVFELLLRLKGNYLWPAMWNSNFNCDGPELLNAELADEYGIVMSTSHHEPCMRNGEEYRHVRGPGSIYGDAWDFRANREGILRFWEDGLKRNGPFENVITLGMRGEQDTAILGQAATLADNIELLRDVIREQNRLIREQVCSDLSQVPRNLVLFTEVEAFFYGDEETPGLMGDPELDGVTLMLCDDNYGNLRSVPTEAMRQHNGGYGLYYHFDFHGGAHAYDWMNTNYLPKVWEQLTTAYDYGIQEIWVVNVGDICFQEYPLSYFFELAYDMETWGSHSPNKTDFFTEGWIDQQFGSAFDQADLRIIQEVLKGYTRVNHNRKPEIMYADTYHPVHYGEAEQLLRQAEQVTAMAEALKARCPDWALPAYYELVYYPAVASMNVQRMQIIAGRNDFYARQNRVEANELAEEIAQCIRRDRELTERLHWINNGKWYGMGMSEHIGFVHWNEEGNRYPLMIRIEPANKPRLIVAKSDDSKYTEGFVWTGKPLEITDFLRPDVDAVRIDIACGSKMTVAYRITTECSWLTFSSMEGLVARSDVITMKVDRTQLRERTLAEVYVESPESRVKLKVWAEPAEHAAAGLEPMTFVERDGYIAMEAEHYADKQDVPGFGFRRLDDYGRTLSAMKVLPHKYDFSEVQERPYLMYRFVAEQDGIYHADFYLAPSNTAYMDHQLCIGIQINDGELQIENAVSESFRSLDTGCPEWMRAVRENIRIYSSQVPCKRGINTLKFYAISPLVVLERIVLYPWNTKLPASYLGPTESFYVPPMALSTK